MREKEVEEADNLTKANNSANEKSREKQLLSFINQQYSLTLTQIELLREGGCITYIVSDESNKYLLKVVSSAFMDTAKQSLNIVWYLNQHQFPVPRLIPTKTQQLYTAFLDDGKMLRMQCDKSLTTNSDKSIVTNSDKSMAILSEFIDGRETEQDEDLEQLGKITAQLHMLMREYPKQLVKHDKDFFINRYLHVLEKKNYPPEKIIAYQKLGDELWERIKDLPRGFSHGDLHRGNLLKTKQGIYYFLDFDTACDSFPMYDVMILCNGTDYFHLSKEGYENTKKYFEEFLKGYETICPLTDREKQAFYDLVLVYHYQLQATIVDIYGIDCIDFEFIDKQMEWMHQWIQYRME